MFVAFELCFKQFLGTSFWIFSKKFNIPKTVLARHYERYRQGSAIYSRGRGTVFADREQLEFK